MPPARRSESAAIASEGGNHHNNMWFDSHNNNNHNNQDATRRSSNKSCFSSLSLPPMALAGATAAAAAATAAPDGEFDNMMQQQQQQQQLNNGGKSHHSKGSSKSTNNNKRKVSNNKNRPPPTTTRKATSASTSAAATAALRESSHHDYDSMDPMAADMVLSSMMNNTTSIKNFHYQNGFGGNGVTIGETDGLVIQTAIATAEDADNHLDMDLQELFQRGVKQQQLDHENKIKNNNNCNKEMNMNQFLDDVQQQQQQQQHGHAQPQPAADSMQHRVIESGDRRSLLFMRQVSGLGMEDPVFGTNDDDDNDIHKNNKKNSNNNNKNQPAFLCGLYNDMTLEDLPEEFRDMVSVASDPTACEGKGFDHVNFHASLVDFTHGMDLVIPTATTNTTMEDNAASRQNDDNRMNNRNQDQGDDNGEEDPDQFEVQSFHANPVVLENSNDNNNNSGSDDNKDGANQQHNNHQQQHQQFQASFASLPSLTLSEAIYGTSKSNHNNSNSNNNKRGTTTRSHSHPPKPRAAAAATTTTTATTNRNAAATVNAPVSDVVNTDDNNNNNTARSNSRPRSDSNSRPRSDSNSRPRSDSNSRPRSDSNSRPRSHSNNSNSDNKKAASSKTEQIKQEIAAVVGDKSPSCRNNTDVAVLERVKLRSRTPTDNRIQKSTTVPISPHCGGGSSHASTSNHDNNNNNRATSRTRSTTGGRVVAAAAATPPLTLGKKPRVYNNNNNNTDTNTLHSAPSTPNSRASKGRFGTSNMMNNNNNNNNNMSKGMLKCAPSPTPSHATITMQDTLLLEAAMALERDAGTTGSVVSKDLIALARNQTTTVDIPFSDLQSVASIGNKSKSQQQRQQQNCPPSPSYPSSPPRRKAVAKTNSQSTTVTARSSMTSMSHVEITPVQCGSPTRTDDSENNNRNKSEPFRVSTPTNHQQQKRPSRPYVHSTPPGDYKPLPAVPVSVERVVNAAAVAKPRTLPSISALFPEDDVAASAAQNSQPSFFSQSPRSQIPRHVQSAKGTAAGNASIPPKRNPAVTVATGAPLHPNSSTGPYRSNPPQDGHSNNVRRNSSDGPNKKNQLCRSNHETNRKSYELRGYITETTEKGILHGRRVSAEEMSCGSIDDFCKLPTSTRDEILSSAVGAAVLNTSNRSSLSLPRSDSHSRLTKNSCTAVETTLTKQQHAGKGTTTDSSSGAPSGGAGDHLRVISPAYCAGGGHAQSSVGCASENTQQQQHDVCLIPQSPRRIAKGASGSGGAGNVTKC